jgi:hypothetical protein
MLILLVTAVAFVAGALIISTLNETAPRGARR